MAKQSEPGDPGYCPDEEKCWHSFQDPHGNVVTVPFNDGLEHTEKKCICGIRWKGLWDPDAKRLHMWWFLHTPMDDRDQDPPLALILDSL